MDNGKRTFGDEIIEILEAHKFFKYDGKIYVYGALKK